jgi:hypothetical protein
MRVTAFLLAFSLFPTFLAAQPIDRTEAKEHPFPGASNWINRQGSVMMLDIGPDGLVQGFFINNAPGKGCRGIPYALRGQMEGETIAFQVKWRNGVADCMSETHWHGHMQPSRNGGFEIVAGWQRSSTVATTSQEVSPERGLDVFTLRPFTNSR